MSKQRFHEAKVRRSDEYRQRTSFDLNHVVQYYEQLDGQTYVCLDNREDVIIDLPYDEFKAIIEAPVPQELQMYIEPRYVPPPVYGPSPTYKGTCILGHAWQPCSDWGNPELTGERCSRCGVLKEVTP
jgi:hypothetical protein